MPSPLAMGLVDLDSRWRRSERRCRRRRLERRLELLEPRTSVEKARSVDDSRDPGTAFSRISFNSVAEDALRRRAALTGGTPFKKSLRKPIANPSGASANTHAPAGHLA